MTLSRRIALGFQLASILFFLMGICALLTSIGPACIADGGGSILSGYIHTFTDTGTWACIHGTWTHYPDIRGQR